MRKLLYYLLLVLPLPALAQPVDFWRHLLHHETLSDTLNMKISNFSSYDRTGHNDDYTNNLGVDTIGWKKICDVDGPGVCTHFWNTSDNMPAAARWRIYVDDMTHPLIDTTVLAIFGHTPPFVPPLADRINWSRWSYVPIPFQSHLKITANNLSSAYYHFSVYTFPAGSTVASLTIPPSADYSTHLDSLAQLFLHPETPCMPNREYSSQVGTATMPNNTIQNLVTYTGSGTCRRVMVLTDAHTLQVHENLWVRIYTDNFPIPDVEGPLSPLFGATMGWHPFQSFGPGMIGDTMYLDFPIPFKTGLRVELENRTGDTRAVYSRAEIIQESAANINPFRLQSAFRDVYPTANWQDYRVFDQQGPGNYLGLFWEMQNTSTGVLEGDENFFFDHETDPSWKGTGTEDYFVGGYFWSDSNNVVRPHQMPSFGCIGLIPLWASAYRLQIDDAIPFRENLKMTMEVGGWKEYVGHYRSVAYLYAQPQRLVVRDETGDGQSFPGEPLHIAARGCSPGAVVDSVFLGPWGLSFLAGSRTVNADSIINLYVTAPAHGHGLYPLTVRTTAASGHQSMTTNWLHYSAPKIEFETAHRDTFTFPADTIRVRIDGITAGQTPTLQIAGEPLTWISPIPQADTMGIVRGKAILPDCTHAGDLSLTSVSEGVENGETDILVPVRHFYRVEAEELMIKSSHGTRDKPTATSYNRVNHTFTWGRDRCSRLSGTQIGDSIVYNVVLPIAGFYRPKYFFGLTGYGARVDVTIDDSLPSLPPYSTYLPVDWHWDRSDTVFGSWYYFSADTHSVKFRITGRDSAAMGWQVVIDQIVFDWTSNIPPTDGLGPSVSGLTIHRTGAGVELRWQPMRAEGFDIYCSSRTDGPFEHCAEVAGDTYRYVDSSVLGGGSERKYYFVIVRSLPLNKSSGN